jgi:hypothetical protein
MNCPFKKKIFAFSFIILYLSALQIYAQNNCSEKLLEAQKLFDAGMIEQTPELLKPCIGSGFTDIERVQAEKLIIQAYLFDNNITEADNAMFAFLNRNPGYEVIATDPAEFVQLFQTYKIVQVGSIGMNLGSSMNFFMPTNIYSLNGKAGDYNHVVFNYQAGISYNHYLSKRFDINLEAYYSKFSYSYTNTFEYTAGLKQTFNESFHNAELPISVLFKGSFNKKISYLIRAGAGMRYLIGSNAVAKLRAKESLTSAEIDMTSYRNPFQFMAIGGVGLAYNLKKSYILFDIRFNEGFMNLVNESKREKTNDLTELYLYNENDFMLHNLYFSIGYFYKFNKPEKISN